MTPAERLASLGPEARAAVLAAMDDLSRPLEKPELDVALAKAGVSRSQRRPLMRALLEQFDVIVIERRR